MRKYVKRNKERLSKLFKSIGSFDMPNHGLVAKRSIYSRNGNTIVSVRLKIVNQELYESSVLSILDSSITGE